MSDAASVVKPVRRNAVTVSLSLRVARFEVLGTAISQMREQYRNQPTHVLAASVVGCALRSWQACAPGRTLTGNAPEGRENAPVMGRAPVMSKKRRREERTTGTYRANWITSERGVSRTILGPSPADVGGDSGAAP